MHHPGCETVQKLSDTEFQASATLTIGPVKTNFEGRVELPPPAPLRMEDGLAPQFWVAGLIGIVILLLIVFSIVL